jgi:hypothetical protein
MKNENNFTFCITQGLHCDSEKLNYLIINYCWSLYNNTAGAKKNNKEEINLQIFKRTY